MTTEPGNIPLAAYLDEIAGRLPGPKRRRTQILAELRDGLEQALAGRTAAGLPTDLAAAAAIDRFGDPHTVADAFAAELAIAYARRTVAWFVATGPLVGIWWLLLLHPRPWRDGPTALLAAVPVIPLVAVAVAAAAATVAATGRLIRWLPEASPRRALDATGAVAVLALLGDVMIIAVYAASDVGVRPLVVVAVAASLIRIACSVRTLHQVIDRAGPAARGTR